MSGGTVKPVEPTVAVDLEPIGSAVRITGIVKERYEDSSVLVDIPATGGALIGLRLDGVTAAVGERVAVPAVVTQAERDVLSITVECQDKSVLQAVDVERARAEVATVP